MIGPTLFGSGNILSLAIHVSTTLASKQVLSLTDLLDTGLTDRDLYARERRSSSSVSYR